MTSPAGVYQRCRSTSPRCAAVKPVGPKSWRVTTGTGPGAPGNDCARLELRAPARDIRASAPPQRPLQHVHDVAVEGDPVADHAVLGRHPPGDQRGQGARRGARGHRGDGPADAAGEHRGQGGRSAQLLLAQAVEHQQHDLAGPGHRFGKPARAARSARVAPARRAGWARPGGGTAPSQSGRSGSGCGRGPSASPWGGRRRRLGRCAVTHEGTPYDPRTPSTHEWAGRIACCEGFHAG